MSSQERSPPSRRSLVTVFSARRAAGRCLEQQDLWEERMPVDRRCRCPSYLLPPALHPSLPPSLPLCSRPVFNFFRVRSEANTASLWVHLLDLLCCVDSTIGWKREAIHVSHIVKCPLRPLCTRNILSSSRKALCSARQMPRALTGIPGPSSRWAASRPGDAAWRPLTMAPWCGRAGALSYTFCCFKQKCHYLPHPFQREVVFFPPSDPPEHSILCRCWWQDIRGFPGK